MSKLLKYHFRHNAVLLLGTLALLLLLQISVLLFVPRGEMAQAYGLAVSLMAYVGACIVAVVACIKSFYMSLRSPSRRLLPLKPVTFIFSSVLFGLICIFIVEFIAFAEGALVKRVLTGGILHDAIVPFRAEDFLAGGVIGLWSSAFYSLTVFLFLAYLFSFRFKGRVAAGILGLILLQNTAAYLETKLFKEQSQEAVQFFSVKLFESDSAGRVAVPVYYPLGSWFTGPFLLELAIAAVMFGVTLWLMKHKVEN